MNQSKPFGSFYTDECNLKSLRGNTQTSWVLQMACLFKHGNVRNITSFCYSNIPDSLGYCIAQVVYVVIQLFITSMQQAIQMQCLQLTKCIYRIHLSSTYQTLGLNNSYLQLTTIIHTELAIFSQNYCCKTCSDEIVMLYLSTYTI